jgi:transposase
MKMVDTKKETSRAGSRDGVRVNRTGRRTYTPQYKRDVVKRCSEPGVSVAGVALAHGINANLLRRWIVQHRHASCVLLAKPQVALLPVTIEAAMSIQDTAAVTTVDAPRKPRAAGTASIEVELYGARIHLRGGIDAQALCTLLDVLARQ